MQGTRGRCLRGHWSNSSRVSHLHFATALYRFGTGYIIILQSIYGGIEFESRCNRCTSLQRINRGDPVVGNDSNLPQNIILCSLQVIYALQLQVLPYISRYIYIIDINILYYICIIILGVWKIYMYLYRYIAMYNVLYIGIDTRKS